MFANVNNEQRFDAGKYQKIALLEGDRSLLDIYCLLPGQEQKVHQHPDRDKYYVVYEGEAVVTIGEQILTLRPGDAALAKATVEHGVRNDSESNVTLFVFQSPKPS